ncbi:unnamed protein product, partial [Arabidopsis halleri]
ETHLFTCPNTLSVLILLICSTTLKLLSHVFSPQATQRHHPNKPTRCLRRTQNQMELTLKVL